MATHFSVSMWIFVTSRFRKVLKMSYYQLGMNFKLQSMDSKNKNLHLQPHTHLTHKICRQPLNFICCLLMNCLSVIIINAVCADGELANQRKGAVDARRE